MYFLCHTQTHPVLPLKPRHMMNEGEKGTTLTAENHYPHDDVRSTTRDQTVGGSKTEFVAVDGV